MGRKHFTADGVTHDVGACTVVKTQSNVVLTNY